MNIVRNNILLTILFIIFPFATLPLIFRDIYLRKKYAQILLAIFMGGLSMYYYPFGDQYRYLMTLDSFGDMALGDVFDIDSIKILSTFNIVIFTIWCAAKIGLTLEFTRCIFISIAYILIFCIFNDIERRGFVNWVSNQFRFMYFLILFLSVPFYFICFGLRSGFGTCIFVYGFYNLFVKNRKKGYFFIVLSAFTHFHFFLYVIFSILASIKISAKYMLPIIVGLAAFVLSLGVSAESIAALDFLMDTYINGTWGSDFAWRSKEILLLLLDGGLVSLYGYWIMFRYANNTSLYRFKNLLYINLGIIICFLTFYTIVERTIPITIIILSLYIILNYKNIAAKSARLFLVLCAIAFLFPFVMHRHPYRQAHIEHIFYYSLPQILMNTYKIEDVNKHVDDAGIFYI